MKKKIALLVVLMAAVHLFAFGAPEPIFFGIPDQDKELMRLNGVVEFRHIAATDWSTVFSSQFVEDTDWVRTQDASLAQLDLHKENQSTTIYERTVVQIENVTPHKVWLRQYIGKIAVVVRHLFEKPTPVEISTPSAVVAIKGSAADCLVLPDGTTKVNASSGHIDVTAQGVTLSITGGQSAIVYPGVPPELLQSLIHATVTLKKTASTRSQQAPSSQSSSIQSQAGPPSGTMITTNSDGTVTYSYTPKGGQLQSSEIPSGVIKKTGPDGAATYTFTTTPPSSLAPFSLGNQARPGMVGIVNPDGTVRYTYVWHPGTPALTNIPSGVTATTGANEIITYTYTSGCGK